MFYGYSTRKERIRQRLIDVLQQIREEGVVYIVESFGRPQAALVNIDEYRRFQQYQEEREIFFQWLEHTSSENAARNRALSEEELLELIETTSG